MGRGSGDYIADPDPVIRRVRTDSNPVETGTLVNQAGYSAPPERLLWRCVLLQAIYDAKGGLVRRQGRHTPQANSVSGYNKATSRRKHQREALAWFGTPDFYTVCDLADVQPDVAMRTVGRKEDCCEKKAS